MFDPSTGFMRGRDTKGGWRTPFDPAQLGHGAGLANDFTEGNSWQYTWHVLQDAKGLSEANKYVRHITLNGHALKEPILRYADIMQGGELVFEMTDRKE